MSKNAQHVMKTYKMRGKILHILVPKPSRGDLYLTISRVSTILSKLGFLVQFLMYVFSRFFWGGAKLFSAARIDLSQNIIGVPWILMFF